MLRDIANLFTGLMRERAPLVMSRAMSPMHTRPSQSANYDVDFVAGVVASAQSGDITPLLTLYRDMESADPTIMSAIMTRKLAVMAGGMNVVAAKNSGAAGQKVADDVEAMLERSESLIDACTRWLHGCVWPVSIEEMKWVPGQIGDWSHPEFREVPLELYDFTQRTMRIKDVGSSGEPLGTTHAPDSNRYILHRGHMVKAPDSWGGPLRALVFWFLFSTQTREWWARFLERFGAPFLMGSYDKNDDESRVMLERAFQEATRIFGIVATRETEVSIHESAGKADASSAFQMFYDCAKNEKLLVILGQTLSGNAQPTGMGSGTADLQGTVKAEYKFWDSFKLGNTIRNFVVKPWMRLNGIKGPAPMVTFGGFDASVFATVAELLKSLAPSGLELADDAIETINRRLGFNLQRRAVPPPMSPFGVGAPSQEDIALALACGGFPPSVVANEAIAEAGSAELSRALSGDLAALGPMVLGSRNRMEFIAKLSAWFPRYRPQQSQPVIEASLASHAGNALITSGKDPGD